MYITRGAVALLVFFLTSILCGIIGTIGVLVVLYGVLWWGIGYLVGTLLISVAGSFWAYRINKGPQNKMQV